MSITISVFFISQLIAFTLSCRAVYYEGQPIAPLDVCGAAYNIYNGDFSTMYRCWNATTVVEEYYEGKDCTGELASAQIVYNISQYTFDCNNDRLCDYTMVRSYVDTSCDNTGSYADIPVVINHCSTSILDGGSKEMKCTESAVEEYNYDSDDCSGEPASREIIYQNGDCGPDLNNYHEISICGDFSIDPEDDKGFTFGFMSCLFVMITSLIIS